MVKIENINKMYGENIGNFDINLEIAEGKVFGILGPNGAGKTTLIRQIMGFIKPDSGSISILGLDPIKNHDKLMEDTGYISGELSLYDNLTGNDFLKLTKKFKNNVDDDFFLKLIDFFELDTKRKIKRMSKGMKQKVAIIAATMNKPKFLVLDEPTSGLDPVMQKRFNELIFKLKNEYNSTIIICSHIFEEVINVCDELVFLKAGKIIEKQLVSEIKNVEELRDKFETIFQNEVKL